MIWLSIIRLNSFKLLGRKRSATLRANIALLENNARVALALEQDALKDVFTEIDPDDRVATLRHDAGILCSGKRADDAGVSFFSIISC